MAGSGSVFGSEDREEKAQKILRTGDPRYGYEKVFRLRLRIPAWNGYANIEAFIPEAFTVEIDRLWRRVKVPATPVPKK